MPSIDFLSNSYEIMPLLVGFKFFLSLAAAIKTSNCITYQFCTLFNWIKGYDKIFQEVCNRSREKKIFYKYLIGIKS